MPALHSAPFLRAAESCLEDCFQCSQTSDHDLNTRLPPPPALTGGGLAYIESAAKTLHLPEALLLESNCPREHIVPIAPCIESLFFHLGTWLDGQGWLDLNVVCATRRGIFHVYFDRLGPIDAHFLIEEDSEEFKGFPDVDVVGSSMRAEN